MKNYDTQAIKNFVYSSNFTTMFVETIVIMQIVACFVAYIFTYNQRLIITLLSPLALCSSIIYILASKTKAADVKRINLLIGLSGIIATITCIVSAVLIIPMDTMVIVKATVALFLLNIIVMIFMVLHARGVVKTTTKKYYTSGALFASATILGFILGKQVLRSQDNNISLAIVLLFIAFSIFFSLTFVCIMRYHYAKILEKFDTEEEK